MLFTLLVVEVVLVVLVVLVLAEFEEEPLVVLLVVLTFSSTRLCKLVDFCLSRFRLLLTLVELLVIVVEFVVVA